MKFKDILSISGQPGLYSFVAQAQGGIIVEALDGGRRTRVGSASKVSSLAEIAIYTDSGETPLGELFTRLYEKNSGARTIDRNAPSEELKKLFSEILPDYDRERVHVSDMKKIVAWYNILSESGMSDFTTEQPQNEETVESQTQVEE